jgi:PilZ domain
MDDSKAERGGTGTERRGGQRLAVRLPVSVKAQDGAGEQRVFTRDLSSKGIFFYLDSEVSAGTELEMVLILPAELTAGEKRWVCCHASVVRVEQNKGQNFGIAAAIQRIDILPEIPGEGEESLLR